MSILVWFWMITSEYQISKNLVFCCFWYSGFLSLDIYCKVYVAFVTLN